MTTAKQLNVRISKEDLRRLKELADRFGENFSQVVKRAINHLYERYTIEENKP